MLLIDLEIFPKLGKTECFSNEFFAVILEIMEQD